ncbi:MAG: hypothetical protein R2838_06240 [Caldilineaceae bacterium]
MTFATRFCRMPEHELGQSLECLEQIGQQRRKEVLAELKRIELWKPVLSWLYAPLLLPPDNRLSTKV